MFEGERRARCGFAYAKPWRKRQSFKGVSPFYPHRRMEGTEKRTKSKGGRPKLGTAKKTERVTFNVNAKQYEGLVKKAESAGLSLPDYARDMTTNGFIKAIHTVEAQAQRVDFIRLSNNLNQLTRQAHIQGLKNLVARFGNAMDEIDLILKKYKV